MNLMSQPSQQVILSVIIPAYNEEKTIGTVIQSVLDVIPVNSEIIVINDGSSDKTAEIALMLSEQYLAVRLIQQPKNMGKTAALITGFAASKGNIVLVQDADLEYDPVDIKELIEPIITGKADVVYG